MKDRTFRRLFWLAYLAIWVGALVWLTGCTSVKAEYEHISHPFAGPPFGPQSEEDWIDHVQLCAVKRAGRAYSEACAGYLLTDGGFHGPRLTGGVRMGIEFGGVGQ